ncbi:MAG: hypothetical protein ABGX25_02395 [Nautiliaceae bacterium]
MLKLHTSVTGLYHKNVTKWDNFWIFFYLANARGDEWIELYLPTPNILIYPKNKNGIFIGYAIDGFFGTSKAKKFLEDIIKRFEITFLSLDNISYVERVYHPPIIDENTHYLLQLERIYSLKDFSTILKSLNSKKTSKKEQVIKNLKIAKALGERKITDDALFDYMRFIAYDFVKTNGKETLTREYLEKIGEIGNEVLGKTKEFSTIRAKAKAIYNWIMENYQIRKELENVKKYIRKLSDEEYEMHKREIALKNSQKIAEETKKKVYDAINKLKEKEEKITVRKVKELAKVSINSASKYIKQAREEGII